MQRSLGSLVDLNFKNSTADDRSRALDVSWASGAVMYNSKINIALWKI